MSGSVCDICTKATAAKVCLCIYPPTRICEQCIYTHCTQTSTSHSLEPVAALNLIKSRGDVPNYIARQQFFQEMESALKANLVVLKAFKLDVESFFAQIDTYRTSKLSEIYTAERTLETSVNACMAQMEAMRFAPQPQPRNRLEFLLAQSDLNNLPAVRRELSMFSATIGQSAQFLSQLDGSIKVAVAPGVHTRGANVALGPPQCAASPTANSPGDEVVRLQRSLDELRLEVAAKDQSLATVKNNRDELKAQYQEKRQEYERTIKDLERRCQGAGGPTHLQDTIQDLKNERRKLIEEKKQYDEALRTLKAEKSALIARVNAAEEQKSKIEKDAVMMAMLLRDKLPEMERDLKSAKAEVDELTELRNGLERLFSQSPLLNIGCIEGKMVVRAQQMIREQKTGNSGGGVSFVRVVVM